MLQPERINPFPKLSFLIEDRAYYNTSDFLVEYKERINKKLNDPKINMDSVLFSFK